MIPNVPTRETAVNSQNISRSSTIDMNCQSCFTCVPHPYNQTRMQSFITSVKEGMFLPRTRCLFVRRQPSKRTSSDFHELLKDCGELLCAAPEIFIWESCGPGSRGTELPQWGSGDPPEAEAVCRHCLEIFNPLEPTSSNYYTLAYRPNLPLLISDIRTLALTPERQSARISEIKNGRLGLYGAKHSKCNHVMTLGFQGLKQRRPKCKNFRTIDPDS